MAVSCLAYLAMHEGDFNRAGLLHEEALDWSRRQGEKWATGITLFDLALLRVVQQRHEEARTLCAEGIGLYREFADRRGIAWCLGILSATEAAEGRTLRAARLRGAMEGLLESVGAPIQVSFNHWIGDRSLDVMRAGLGDSAFDAAVAEGRSMPLSRAIQFGLEHETTSSEKRSASDPDQARSRGCAGRAWSLISSARMPPLQKEVFLKTIIPSRKATKHYLGEESDDEA